MYKLAWGPALEQQVMKTAKNIIGIHLASGSDISEVRLVQRIPKEDTCPSLFILLACDKRYKSICCRSTRLRSIFSPQAVILQIHPPHSTIKNDMELSVFAHHHISTLCSTLILTITVFLFAL